MTLDERTWQLLSEHFPGYESEFYSGSEQLQERSLIGLACLEEIKQQGGDPTSFLEARIATLGQLLREIGAQA